MNVPGFTDGSAPTPLTGTDSFWEFFTSSILSAALPDTSGGWSALVEGDIRGVYPVACRRCLASAHSRRIIHTVTALGPPCVPV
jgi:hypothetical protein